MVVRKPTYKKWWLDFQGIYIYISESPPETQEPPKSSVTVFASAEMWISKSKDHSENCGWDGPLNQPLQYTLYSLYSVYSLGI